MSNPNPITVDLKNSVQLVKNTDDWIEPFSIERVYQAFPRLEKEDRILTYGAETMTIILNHIANCGLFNRSCASVGMPIKRFNKYRDEYPELEVLVQEARQHYRELLQMVVHNRAVHGTLKDVYYKGEVVGEEVVHHDRLLEIHIKRHCPEYRENTNAAGVNLNAGVLVIQQSDLSKEEWLQKKRVQSAEVPDPALLTDETKLLPSPEEIGGDPDASG
jgi:hypothetical protein